MSNVFTNIKKFIKQNFYKRVLNVADRIVAIYRNET